MPELVDIGWNHMRDGDYDAALDCFHLAIATAPDDARAHLSCAEALLATGQFLPGWREFTWRRHHNAVTTGFIGNLHAPEWNGMRLPRGRLLILCDEGLGDAIMFARFIPLAAERCAEIVIGYGPHYAALFAGLSWDGRICASAEDLPHHYDAWCLICDLPHIFGATPATLPATPYFSAAGAAVARWAPWLDQAMPSGHRRIGLAWSGNPAHVNDANRSLRLEQLSPLLARDHVAFVSLQQHIRDQDRATLADTPGLLDLSDRLHDLVETAAVVAQLDLVISVDTAVAHLAAALGKPVWLLLPRPADWRWLTEGDTSPWYPTMRLFRQARPRDWDPVIAALVEALPAPNDMSDIVAWPEAA